MRLVAITRPDFMPERFTPGHAALLRSEARAIVRLLDRGWWRVHIRKPGASPESLASLLELIPEAYRSCLSLHDCFGLAAKYGIGGLHLNSRNPTPPESWRGMISRSCHSMEEVRQFPHYDYLTLSPVFDSISKPGYTARFSREELRNEDLSNVFALGGVTFSRLPELERTGFAGAAMLSEAWRENPLIPDNLPMLQFITHTDRGLEDILRGGCRWVQLRMKEASDHEFSETARRIIPLCRKYDSKVILDDRVHLVIPLGADGVHLGKNDMPLPEARSILGPERIIGATANTREEAMKAFRPGADYLGIGPLRFTTTKKNLAPVLGLDGYRRMMSDLRREGMTLPVVAIGGITLGDIPALRLTGVDGIAVSGLLLNSPDPLLTTQEIITSLR
ncbi:MAG: thiamine phosphate synthase [Muribaculaceae bacterium]|nr:thiamine phosphate synthase [Muribaculaceae bacterium]